MIIQSKNTKNKKIQIDLSGPEGNAFCILGMVPSLCRQLKQIDPVKYDKERIISEMQSSDYDNLIRTFDKYFGDYVEIYNFNPKQ